jgi:hypothetical protein
MDTAMKTVSEGSPLIIVDGSGQAADVIAYAYHLVHDVDKDSKPHHSLDGAHVCQPIMPQDCVK